MMLKIGTLQKADQKHLQSFKTCSWRRMENINWTDRVRNGVLHTVKEDRYIRSYLHVSLFVIARLRYSLFPSYTSLRFTIASFSQEIFTEEIGKVQT